MLTEILGLMIIAGTLLVLAVRYITKRQQRPLEEQQEMQHSTARLKEELERSGDAIVERLRSHVTHLEELIREADAKNALLDAKISESRRLEAEISQRTDELHLLLEQARASQRQFSAQLGPVRTDARNFASVLKNSIERDPAYVPAAPPPPAPQPTPAAPAADSRPAKTRDTAVPRPAPPARKQSSPSHSAQQAESLAEAMTRRQPEADQPGEKEGMQPGEPNPGTAAAKARALLLSGYSVEEVAKDTGLGKRAVELIQQMHKSV